MSTPAVHVHYTNDMDIYYSTCTRQDHNIALENYLLEQTAQPVMLVWRGTPAIVVGRHQHPWQEVNMPLLKAMRIPLYRRTTGGGTVFHDMGNLNFCVISRQVANHKQRMEQTTSALCHGLHAMGIKAKSNKHFDILVVGKKISGSAFRISKGNLLHHGTLLINARLNLLSRCLHSELSVRDTIAIQSRRSAVTNLSAYRPLPLFGKTRWFIEQWLQVLPTISMPHLNLSSTVHRIDPTQLMGIEELTTRTAHLNSWEWKYGRTPPSTLAIKLSAYQFIELSLYGGTIRSIAFRASQAAAQLLTDWCTTHLVGRPYTTAIAAPIAQFHRSIKDNTVLRKTCAVFTKALMAHAAPDDAQLQAETQL